MVVDLILPYLMPPSQYRSDTFRMLVREILACNIVRAVAQGAAQCCVTHAPLQIHPILQMLADPDYINQNIEYFVRYLSHVPAFHVTDVLRARRAGRPPARRAVRLNEPTCFRCAYSLFVRRRVVRTFRETLDKMFTMSGTLSPEQRNERNEGRVDAKESKGPRRSRPN